MGHLWAAPHRKNRWEGRCGAVAVTAKTARGCALQGLVHPNAGTLPHWPSVCRWLNKPGCLPQQPLHAHFQDFRPPRPRVPKMLSFNAKTIALFSVLTLPSFQPCWKDTYHYSVGPCHPTTSHYPNAALLLEGRVKGRKWACGQEYQRCSKRGAVVVAVGRSILLCWSIHAGVHNVRFRSTPKMLLLVNSPGVKFLDLLTFAWQWTPT